MIQMTGTAFAEERPEEPSSTVIEVLQNGTAISAEGQVYELFFAEDGTYTNPDTEMDGSYTIDGSTICIIPDAIEQEICADTPEGKQSGDSFLLATTLGSFIVTIK